MNKPAEFRKTYMLSTDVSYHEDSVIQKGTHASEGTLARGRVVWLERDPQAADGSERVPAYAEGVGVVLLAAESVQPLA